MARGRKPHIDPPAKFEVSIPTSLAARVELLLYDPIAGKPRYGGRSQLVQELLSQWVAGQISQNQTENTNDLKDPV